MNRTTTVDVGPLHVTFDAADPATLVWFTLLNVLVHSILPLPVSSVFWMSAVVLYGFWAGFAIAILSSALGCYLALPITRCFRPFIIHLLGPEGQATWRAMDRAIVRERWKIPLLVRATPVMPVVPSNFLLALTSIDDWTYAWTVCVGLIPSGLPYAYAAIVGQQVLEQFPPEDPLVLISLLVGLVATVLAVYKIGTIAAHELLKHGVESPRTPQSPHWGGGDSSSGAQPQAQARYPDAVARSNGDSHRAGGARPFLM